MKMVSERKFPVTLGQYKIHTEETGNGTLIQFGWQFGPDRSRPNPERLFQNLTIVVYSYGNAIAKYTLLFGYRGYEGYESIEPLFRKEGGVELSFSNQVFRFMPIGRPKHKRFGQDKLPYPSSIAIQKFDVTQRASK